MTTSRRFCRLCKIILQTSDQEYIVVYVYLMDRQNERVKCTVLDSIVLQPQPQPMFLFPVPLLPLTDLDLFQDPDPDPDPDSFLNWD
jgi:hypothetical protein